MLLSGWNPGNLWRSPWGEEGAMASICGQFACGTGFLMASEFSAAECAPRGDAFLRQATKRGKIVENAPGGYRGSNNF